MEPPTTHEATPAACWIRKRKRPGGNGLWGAYELERDGSGVWLYTPQGSRYRGTQPDGSVAECFAGQPTEPGLHVLQLVPSVEEWWWFAHWTVSGGDRNISIDICTPAELTGDEWSYVDLELDLYKSSDGTLGVFDEDEFDTALGEGLISDQERRKCLDTAAQLLARLGTDDPVLDRLAWSRLEAAVAVDLPAITKP